MNHELQIELNHSNIVVIRTPASRNPVAA